MPELRVVHVFVDERGRAGNPLGVILDAGAISTAERQRTAARLAYSETVFADAGARLQIFTPTLELAFAGHPLVGAAWLLGVPVLHPPAGPVAARRAPPLTWIVGRPEFCPAWELCREGSAAAVDARSVPPRGHAMHWAYADETGGLIRARVFAADYGIAEDPATGSAAIVLCAALGRALTIDQGAGSEIHVQPCGGGAVELGGRVRAG